MVAFEWVLNRILASSQKDYGTYGALSYLRRFLRVIRPSLSLGLCATMKSLGQFPSKPK